MTGLRFILRVTLLSGGLPLLCVSAYLSLSVCLVALAAAQVPSAARAPILAWAAGAPGSGSGSGALPFSHAAQGNGYQGPESFRCILPPVQGYLTDPYGTVRPQGLVHLGIDYGTYYTPVDVRTPFGGQVVFAGSAGSYGNLVIVENAGYRLYLAHHSEMFVLPGQQVQAGDVVGRSGSTGNSSGIHVHLETRIWNGDTWVAVDPQRVRLPGQVAPCDWEMLTLPEMP